MAEPSFPDSAGHLAVAAARLERVPPHEGAPLGRVERPRRHRRRRVARLSYHLRREREMEFGTWVFIGSLQCLSQGEEGSDKGATALSTLVPKVNYNESSV